MGVPLRTKPTATKVSHSLLDQSALLSSCWDRLDLLIAIFVFLHVTIVTRKSWLLDWIGQRMTRLRPGVGHIMRDPRFIWVTIFVMRACLGEMTWSIWSTRSPALSQFEFCVWKLHPLHLHPLLKILLVLIFIKGELNDAFWPRLPAIELIILRSRFLTFCHAMPRDISAQAVCSIAISMPCIRLPLAWTMIGTSDTTSVD